MSLYSLIYNIKQGISSANDLILIMNTGVLLYWKSVVFKVVSISQTVLFNADRITYNLKWAWYWLWTRIQWKLHWHCCTDLWSRCVQMIYLWMTTPRHRNFYFLRTLQSHMTLTSYLFQIYTILISCVYKLDVCRFNIYQWQHLGPAIITISWWPSNYYFFAVTYDTDTLLTFCLQRFLEM